MALSPKERADFDEIVVRLRLEDADVGTVQPKRRSFALTGQRDHRNPGVRPRRGPGRPRGAGPDPDRAGRGRRPGAGRARLVALPGPWPAVAGAADPGSFAAVSAAARSPSRPSFDEG